MRRIWLAGLASGLLLGACVDEYLAFVCTTHEECSSQDGGLCEPDSLCSYPDDNCSTGRRYGNHAGMLSGQCAGMLDGSGDSADTVAMTLTTTTTGTATETTATETPPTSTTIDPDSSDDSNQPICGDEIVEGDEECDDGNDQDGDGCNTDCVRGGSIRWERLVAGDANQNDTYFGLMWLGSGRAVAVGHIRNQTDQQDILLSRWLPDGTNDIDVVHDAGGDEEEAWAITQGNQAELYVCGSSNADGTERPWISRWTPTLSDMEEEVILTAVPGDCFDLAYMSNSRVVAVGGNGSAMDNRVWTYSFRAGDLTDSEIAEVTGTGGRSNFKEAVRNEDGDLWIAGELESRAVVYRQDDAASIGVQLFWSTGQLQPQSMLVDGDRLVMAGLTQEMDEDADQWMQALTTGGDPIWDFTIGGREGDEIEDVALGPAGSIYAIGHVRSGMDSNRWVAKFDPEGTLIWERDDYPMSEMGDDRGRSIEVIEGGDLIVVAEVCASGDNDDRDAWIARLAP